MGYMRDGLTFNTLRGANKARLPFTQQRQARSSRYLPKATTKPETSFSTQTSANHLYPAAIAELSLVYSLLDWATQETRTTLSLCCRPSTS